MDNIQRDATEPDGLATRGRPPRSPSSSGDAKNALFNIQYGIGRRVYRHPIRIRICTRWRYGRYAFGAVDWQRRPDLGSPDGQEFSGPINSHSRQYRYQSALNGIRIHLCRATRERHPLLSLVHFWALAIGPVRHPEFHLPDVMTACRIVFVGHGTDQADCDPALLSPNP